MTEQLQLEIIIGIAIPIGLAMIPITWKTINFLIKREICFRILKENVKKQGEELKNKVSSSGDTHTDLYQKQQAIEDIQTKHGIYLKLIMDHLKIPYTNN